MAKSRYMVGMLPISVDMVARICIWLSLSDRKSSNAHIVRTCHTIVFVKTVSTWQLGQSC